MKRTHLIALLLAFVVLEALLFTFIDKPLSEYMRSVDQTHPEYINFFRAYTDAAKGVYNIVAFGFATFLCAGLMRLPFIKTETRIRAAQIGRKFFFGFACLIASGIVTDIVKTIIGRARPVMLDQQGIYGFHLLSFDARWQSMPSGHATTAFTLAMIGTTFFPAGRGFWLLLGAALTISRVMVNAHYLSDILAGALVGCMTVYALRPYINHNVTNHITRCIFPIDKNSSAI